MTNEPLWVIYGLRLVDDPEYRYVGLTRVGTKKRLDSHKKYARNKNRRNSPVGNWVRKHMDNVVIEVLEDCPEGDSEYLFEAEKFWISQVRGFGHNLTNLSEGGASGAFGARYKRPESQIRRGKDSPNYGRKLSEDHIKRMSDKLRGRKLSEETRRKMSASHTGVKRTFSKEHLSNIAASNKARKGLPNPSAHIGYHTNRGVSKPDTCKFCKEEADAATNAVG